MQRRLMMQSWRSMWCHGCSLSVREATSGCVVGRRRLTIHLTIRTTRLTEALRCAMGFRSLFWSRDQIALDLDGLLCFDQVLV